MQFLFHPYFVVQALQLMQGKHQTFLQTYLPSLDTILHGGLSSGTITEVGKKENLIIIRNISDLKKQFLMLQQYLFTDHESFSPLYSLANMVKNIPIQNYLTCHEQVTGPPGCGKTQLCLMISSLTAIDQLKESEDGSIVYIDTENAFTAKR